MYYVMHVCGCSDNQSQIELDYTFMARKMLLHMTQANDLKNASSVVACMYYMYYVYVRVVCTCVYMYTPQVHVIHATLYMYS